MSIPIFTSSTPSKRSHSEDPDEQVDSYKHLHMGSGMAAGEGAVKKMSPSNSVITISFSRPAYIWISAIMGLLFVLAFLNRGPMVSVKSGIPEKQFHELLEKIEELNKEVKQLNRH